MLRWFTRSPAPQSALLLMPLLGLSMPLVLLVTEALGNAALFATVDQMQARVPRVQPAPSCRRFSQDISEKEEAQTGAASAQPSSIDVSARCARRAWR